TTHIRDLEPAAADFLKYFTQAMGNERDLRDLVNDRTLHQTQKMITEISDQLDVDKATPGTRRDYLLWMMDRYSDLDLRGIVPTERRVVKQVKLDDVYVTLQAQREESLDAAARRPLDEQTLESDGRLTSAERPLAETEDHRRLLLSRLKPEGGISSLDSMGDVQQLDAVVDKHDRIVI